MKVDELAVVVSQNNDAIEKDDSKCIKCGNCRKVCVDEVVSNKLVDKLCINCGQCANVCPTEAIHERFDYSKIKDILKNKNGKKVVMSIAPAIRVSLSEEFEEESGENLESIIPTIMKKLGVDYAFDITFGADMTVVEEAKELVIRLKNKERLPQFSSCCPAWVKYVEIFHPELINNLSTTKSPIAIQSSVIKTYFVEKENLKPEDIINIVIAPCTAKKSEINRKELSITNKDTDYILTTREFIKLIKEENIDIKTLEKSKFDSPLGTGSGAGVIFGSSGGVCEAVLRTAYYIITNTNLEKLEFSELRNIEGLKETILTADNITIKAAVCSGIKIAKELIDKGLEYDFVEVMNCEGGCVAGGGQPKESVKEKEETIKSRNEALFEEDKKMKIRLCHQNPEIIKIYKEFFELPGSSKAKEILHTKYEDKSYMLKE